MKRRNIYALIVLFLIASLVSPAQLFARSSGRSSGYHSKSYSSHSRAGNSSKSYSSQKVYRGSSSKAVPGVKRDSNGRIKRSSAAKKEFMKESGYSKGRKGYVVDHVVPLKRGGADSPSNMQWQTKEAAKAKDKIE
jgi:hypothetical protein